MANKCIKNTNALVNISSITYTPEVKEAEAKQKNARGFNVLPVLRTLEQAPSGEGALRSKRRSKGLAPNLWWLYPRDSPLGDLRDIPATPCGIQASQIAHAPNTTYKKPF